MKLRELLQKDNTQFEVGSIVKIDKYGQKWHEKTGTINKLETNDRTKRNSCIVSVEIEGEEEGEISIETDIFSNSELSIFVEEEEE